MGTELPGYPEAGSSCTLAVCVGDEPAQPKLREHSNPLGKSKARKGVVVEEWVHILFTFTSPISSTTWSSVGKAQEMWNGLELIINLDRYLSFSVPVCKLWTIILQGIIPNVKWNINVETFLIWKWHYFHLGCLKNEVNKHFLLQVNGLCYKKKKKKSLLTIALQAQLLSDVMIPQSLFTWHKFTWSPNPLFLNLSPSLPWLLLNALSSTQTQQA